ncbi:MAG: formyltransferase family protein [Eubacteriales bacterium]|nr:formyltransferase family protein [Eubacteriales bacterium]
MKVLLLSQSETIKNYLISDGYTVEQTMDRVEDSDADFVVSYGYRHILKKPFIDKFKDRAVNLHISYLPWNRGADPNLWSFIDGTPKGVTIHFMAEGIDEGDIIAQRYMKYDYNTDTLKTFYDKLAKCVEDLFMSTWKYISEGRAKRYPQTTYHTLSDKIPYEALMPDGWDTPIKSLMKGLKKKEKK